MLIYLKWICFGVWLDKKQWIKIFATAHIFIKIWDVKTGERSGRGGGGGVIMICSLWLFEKYLCSVFFNDAISLLKTLNWYIKIFQISNPQDVVFNHPPWSLDEFFGRRLWNKAIKFWPFIIALLSRKSMSDSKILIKIIFPLLPLQRRRQLSFYTLTIAIRWYRFYFMKKSVHLTWRDYGGKWIDLRAPGIPFLTFI